MSETGCCCCCCGGGPAPTFAWVAERLDSGRYAFFHAVVWDKSDRGNGMGWRFRRNYEFIMVSHIRGRKLAWVNNDKAVPNIMRIAPVRERIHPNEKPVLLAQTFVELTTSKGETVCDPFMGSATTGAACVRTGRRFIGIELGAKEFDIACRRIEAEYKRLALFEPPPVRKRQRTLTED